MICSDPFPKATLGLAKEQAFQLGGFVDAHPVGRYSNLAHTHIQTLRLCCSRSQAASIRSASDSRTRF